MPDFAFGLPLTALWVRRRDSLDGRALPHEGATFRGALRQREFWLLAATLFLSSIAAHGALTQLAAHHSDRGVSA
jgi:hypothetical protein